MARKYKTYTDAEYAITGRRAGSEDVATEAKEVEERWVRDMAVLTQHGYGNAALTTFRAVMAAHTTARTERPDAVAAKSGSISERDAAIELAWAYVHRVEGALSIPAEEVPALADELNAKLPGSDAELPTGIRAMAGVLSTHRARVDPDFDVDAELAAAPTLADRVEHAPAAASTAKGATVSDTFAIDVLDGKLIRWMSRLNRTARRAFRDAGNPARVNEYTYHHILSGRGSRPATTGTPGTTETPPTDGGTPT